MGLISCFGPPWIVKKNKNSIVGNSIFALKVFDWKSSLSKEKTALRGSREVGGNPLAYLRRALNYYLKPAHWHSLLPSGCSWPLHDINFTLSISLITETLAFPFAFPLELPPYRRLVQEELRIFHQVKNRNFPTTFGRTFHSFSPPAQNHHNGPTPIMFAAEATFRWFREIIRSIFWPLNSKGGCLVCCPGWWLCRCEDGIGSIIIGGRLKMCRVCYRKRTWRPQNNKDSWTATFPRMNYWLNLPALFDQVPNT